MDERIKAIVDSYLPGHKQMVESVIRETLKVAQSICAEHAVKVEGDRMLSTRTSMTRCQAAQAVSNAAQAILKAGGEQ